MDKITILVEGYAHPGEDDIYVASPTSTLIYHQDKKILVDPGTNATSLLEALGKESLKPEDIDILFLSHYHPDHFLNIRLFPNHDLYDGSMLWRKDEEIAYTKKLPGTEIQVIPTPGHAPEQCSLIVETKEYGIVCVAQDVFWWEDGKQKSDTVKDLMDLKDPFAADEKALKESREKVLEIADWIIPGHGKMFKNPLR